MRVLLVVHGFPPLAQGGSEIYAQTHARALARRGVTVVVFTREADATRPEYAVRHTEQDGLRIVWVNNTFRDVRSFAESYTNPRIADLATQLIADARPDVAHVHHLTCLSTLIPARLASANVPAFMTLHDYWLLCHRGQLLDRNLRVCTAPAGTCTHCIDPAAVSPAAGQGAVLFRRIAPRLPDVMSRRLRQTGAALAGAASSDAAVLAAARARAAHMREATRSIACFFAPSEALLERFVAAGYPRERLRLSRYGFEDTMAEERARRATSVSEPLRAGFVGSLMVSKAPHILLEAVADLPAGTVSVHLFGAHASYHGDDSYRQRLAPRLGSPFVTMHGPVPHERMRDAFAAIDVLVVPSVWPENSPLVIQEAHQAGVPVVAANIGGIGELIEDGQNGLLFEPGNVDALRRILARLAGERALLDTLRRSGTPIRSIDDDAAALGLEYSAAIERRVAGHAPAVHAVVLNYHTPDRTRRAVDSLLASAHPLAALTVIDNSADVECGRALRAVSDKVGYSSNSSNLGFSGGMNVGIRRALDSGASHVLLVNSDVVVPPECLGELLDALAACPSAGIAGPTICAVSDPERIESAGLTYSHHTGRMRLRLHGAHATASAASVTRVDAVSGCLMLVDRRVFEAVGQLDEAYFFGFEDLDFCLRARRAGFASIVARVRVHHESGASMAPTSDDRLYYAARNHLRLANTYGNTFPVSAAARRWMVTVLNVMHAVRTGPSSAATRVRAVLMGVRDYHRGRFGARSVES